MNPEVVKRKKLLRKSTKENQIHLQIDSSSIGVGRNEGGGSGGDGCNEGDRDKFQRGSGSAIVTNFPKKLSSEEKNYLLAVRNGNLNYVKRVTANAANGAIAVDVNCVDSLGRGAIDLAIENENLEMVRLLIVTGVAPRDALLHAINAEFVEAVELLLEYEELIYVEGEKYSWEKVDWSTAVFTPDITPLILAASKNNFEILKILLERGATIPKPHHIGCECSTCSQESRNDSLRHSMSRVNEYRALASPSLISLTSDDPILTSFELSWELRKLAKEEKECHKEYTELRKQCQQFAVDLLDQTRSSEELAIILQHYDYDYDDDDDFDDCDNGYDDNSCECECKRTSSSTSSYARTSANTSYKYDKANTSLNPNPNPNPNPNLGNGYTMSCDEIVKLPLLRLAIKYRQKKFIAHPHVQQLLSKIWYDGLPGFRSKSLAQKCYDVTVVAVLFPVYCVSYMLFPESEFGRTLKKPIMKFLVHVTSYLFFLGLLILVSQRAQVLVIQVIGTERMKQNLIASMRKQRGNAPTFLEWNVLIYVLGYVKQQILEMKKIGVQNYVRGSLWNTLEVMKNLIYSTVVALRIYAYACEQAEIRRDASTAFVPREKWNMFDPQLIAEALFATANILSALKLVHIFSVNSHLGPLQISLGRIFIDILKFFSIYALVLFSFACGLNQLLWYYAALERKKCFTLPDDTPDWEHAAESCTKWRSFGNLFESLQTLFWTGFGEVGVDSFDLAGINSYTRFCALLMFAAYSVLNVTVLLNLLIAMMSNSYSIIADQADVEWKFARSKLWINFFEEKSTLPSPYNILPTKKTLRYVSSFFQRRRQPRPSLTSPLPPQLRCKRSTRSDQDHSCSQSQQRPRQQRQRQRRRHLDNQRRCPRAEFSRVMRALVWRYMSAKHRESENNLVTEDHLQEIKSDISGLKSHLLDALEKYAAAATASTASTSTSTSTPMPTSGYEGETLCKMPTSAAAAAATTTTSFSAVASNKKQRIWQRQLMNDFHVGLLTKRYAETNENATATATAFATARSRDGQLAWKNLPSQPEKEMKIESAAAKQTRIGNAENATGTGTGTGANREQIATSDVVIEKHYSQIGKCQREESLKKQLQLQIAIDQAANTFKYGNEEGEGEGEGPPASSEPKPKPKPKP